MGIPKRKSQLLSTSRLAKIYHGAYQKINRLVIRISKVKGMFETVAKDSYFQHHETQNSCPQHACVMIAKFIYLR